MQKIPDSELAPFAKLLGMSTADVRELMRKGVVSVREGKLDTAQSLLAVARHLLATRDTAEAKARAAQAEAELKEYKLKAAKERAQKPTGKGGKSKWSKAAGERICEAVANGASFRKACEKAGVKYSTAQDWRKAHADFADQYARACEIKYHGYVDELDDTLEEANEAALDPAYGNQRLAALKLRIDTRKWQLSKMLPKIYGDRTQMVLEQPNAKDVLPSHTAEEDAAFMAMLARVQAKTPEPEDITPTDED